MIWNPSNFWHKNVKISAQLQNQKFLSIQIKVSYMQNWKKIYTEKMPFSVSAMSYLTLFYVGGGDTAPSSMTFPTIAIWKMGKVGVIGYVNLSFGIVNTTKK